MDGIKKSTKILTSIGAYFGNVFDFYDMQILSLVLVNIAAAFKLSTIEAGLLGTGTLIGCGVSAFVWGWVADIKGRKPAMLASIIGFSVFTFLIGFTSSFASLLIVRFLSGIALGGVNVLVSTVINEVWPPRSRGKATSIVMTSSVVGVTLASTLVSVFLPTQGWRFLFMLAAFGIIVAIFYWIFVPESEVWKTAKRERELAGGPKVSFKDNIKLIFSKEHRKTTIMATVVGLCAQLAFWGVMFWLPTFLIKERHVAPPTVGTYMILNSLGAFVGNIVIGAIADKVGRKKAAIGLFIFGTIAVPFAIAFQSPAALMATMPLIGISFSYPGVLFTFFPEFFPTKVRSLGVGFVYNIGRALSAIGPYTLAIIATSYSLQTGMIVCAGIFFLGGVFTLFLPETFKRKDTASQSKAS